MYNLDARDDETASASTAGLVCTSRNGAQSPAFLIVS